MHDIRIVRYLHQRLSFVQCFFCIHRPDCYVTEASWGKLKLNVLLLKILPFKSTSRMMELEDWLEKYMLSAALMVLWREARGNFREEREKRLNKWWANFLLQSLYIRILIMLSTSSWQHTKKPAEVSSQGCRWMSLQPASSACCLHCGTKFRLTSFKALFSASSPVPSQKSFSS